MHNVELLAPAGNLEQIKLAINCGADAVYIGGEFFNISSTMKNFSKDELVEGIRFVHEKEKKIFITINIMPHNEEFNKLEEYLLWLNEIKIDAVIISDPGVLAVIKNITPNMKVHLSSQANITNYQSANFWYNNGIKRIVVSSEMSLKEISEIRAKTSLDMDIEATIHGSVCISHSGRKLVSNYLEGRNENYESETRYNLMEEKRPGEYFPIYEDDKGTFFFNSDDLCMIEDIPDLIKSGITSLKLEGRMKNNEYISTIVKTYRIAIDEFLKSPTNWEVNSTWIDELKKVSSRPLSKGFYSENLELDGE